MSFINNSNVLLVISLFVDTHFIKTIRTAGWFFVFYGYFFSSFVIKIIKVIMIN